jgi:hypothetical protein
VKRLAVVRQQGVAGKTTSVIRRVLVVDGFDKDRGADRRGIARRECFT